MGNDTQGPNPVDFVMQLSTGYVASAGIHAITRLGVADLLSSGPKKVSDLAVLTSTNEDILYRILRALASVGMFTEIEERTFANTPVSEVLCADHPAAMRDMVLWIADAFHFDTYRDMMPTLRDGKTALEHIHNKPPFEVIFSMPEIAKTFNNSMTAFSGMVYCRG